MLSRESFKQRYKDALILDAPAAEPTRNDAGEPIPNDDVPFPVYLVHGAGGPNEAIAVVMGAIDPSEALTVAVQKGGLDTSSRPARASVYPSATRNTVKEWLGKLDPNADVNIATRETFATEEGRAQIRQVAEANDGFIGTVSVPKGHDVYPKTARAVTVTGGDVSPFKVLVLGVDRDEEAVMQTTQVLQSRGVPTGNLTMTVEQGPDAEEAPILKAPKGFPVAEPAPAGVNSSERGGPIDADFVPVKETKDGTLQPVKEIDKTIPGDSPVKVPAVAADPGADRNPTTITPDNTAKPNPVSGSSEANNEPSGTVGAPDGKGEGSK